LDNEANAGSAKALNNQAAANFSSEAGRIRIMDSSSECPHDDAESVLSANLWLARTPSS
jgi:hypothetical protein